MVNRILEACGVAPVTRSISAASAYRIGAVLERVHGVFRIKKEPRMTRFVARELSTSHWFDLSAAKEILGYRPTVSMEEGLRRLAEWFKESEREAS